MASPFADVDTSKLRLKTWPWWHSDFGDKLTPQGRDILEKCGVPAKDMENHIYAVRERAWEVFPFPCIGEFWFIEFGLAHHPYFQQAVTHLKTLGEAHPLTTTTKDGEPGSHQSIVEHILRDPAAPRALDVGTCVGQDVRLFRHEGAPPRCLYGTDIFAGFEAIGHDLFRDKDVFSSRFFQADVFSEDPQLPLNATAALWDIVSATMFTHQFDLARQRIIAERLIRLLRPCKGSAIIGTSTGQLEAMDVPLKPPFCKVPGERMMYRQSKETMYELWTGAISRCGEEQSHWQVFCEYDEDEVLKRERERKEQGEVRFFQGVGQRRIFFWIQRLQ